MVQKIPRGFLTTREVLKKSGLTMPLFRKMISKGVIPKWLKLKQNLGRGGGVHNYWNDNIFWYIRFFQTLRRKGKTVTKIVNLLPDNVLEKHRVITEKVLEGESQYYKLLVASERKERGVDVRGRAIVIEVVKPDGSKEVTEVVFLNDEIERVEKILKIVPCGSARIVYKE